MKVKYVGASLSQIRWGGNDDSRGVLTVGKIYEVVDKEIHSWHTKYTLKGHEDKKFNSVCFERIYNENIKR